MADSYSIFEGVNSDGGVDFKEYSDQDVLNSTAEALINEEVTDTSLGNHIVIGRYSLDGEDTDYYYERVSDQSALATNYYSLSSEQIDEILNSVIENTTKTFTPPSTSLTFTYDFKFVKEGSLQELELTQEIGVPDFVIPVGSPGGGFY